jgi:large subunit ribosomal protein L14
MAVARKSTKQRAPIQRTTRGLQTGSRLLCIDNSGAKIVEIISVISYQSRRRRRDCATVGDMIVASVKKGNPDIRKKMIRAVVVRQRKEYSRPDGIKVKFEDNACVQVTDDGMPKGSEIKGVIAREAIERWPNIAKIASGVV